MSENHNPEKGFWVTLGDTCFRKWLAIMSWDVGGGSVKKERAISNSLCDKIKKL